MKHYLQFNKGRLNKGRSKKSHISYNLRHNCTLIFKKMEFVFFCHLCVVFLISSKVNEDFSRKFSLVFINISLPVINLVALPFNVTIDLLTNFKDLVNARENNETLKLENEKLQSFYINSLNISRENSELKKTLRFIAPKSSHYKVAHVNGRSHKAFSQILYIDVGENVGIKEGSIVSGNYGAIGRIDEVFEDKSRLILATNANSRIPIITSKSRVRGILAGSNSSVMDILYLQKDHAIEVGDWVFTSGDGDSLPSGILIGVVKKVGESYAKVELVENISNTDVVTIMEY